MAEDTNEPYPIQDPNELRQIAVQICQEMKGTDDAPAMAASRIAEYPPLYTAALGIMVAKLSSTPEEEDATAWMAKFLLALAQDRVRSVVDRSGEPHWPEWMEDASRTSRVRPRFGDGASNSLTQQVALTQPAQAASRGSAWVRPRAVRADATGKALPGLGLTNGEGNRACD
jgi:hypothetical protein